jgi:hypothetical protein
MADTRRPSTREDAIPYDPTRGGANQMTMGVSKKVSRQRVGRRSGLGGDLFPAFYYCLLS